MRINVVGPNYPQFKHLFYPIRKWVRDIRTVQIQIRWWKKKNRMENRQNIGGKGGENVYIMGGGFLFLNSSFIQSCIFILLSLFIHPPYFTQDTYTTTPDTMPSSSSSSHGGWIAYEYYPSMAAAVIFIILFIAVTAFHTYHLIRTRTWFFIPLVLGGYCTVPFPGCSK